MTDWMRTLGPSVSSGRTVHPRTLPRTRHRSPVTPAAFLRVSTSMAVPRFTPALRRGAFLLMVWALVATLSPGLVLAANGAPHPIADSITTAEGVTATGNVMDNDTNNGEDPMTVTAFVALDPSNGTLDIAPDGDYTFT